MLGTLVRVFAALILIAWIAPAALAAPTLEAFSEPPKYVAPDISPSGRYIAIAQNQTKPIFVLEHNTRFEKSQYTLAIIDTENPTAKPAVVVIKDAGVLWLQWAREDRLLVAVAGGGIRIVAFDAQGKNEAVLFQNRRLNRYVWDASQIVHLLPDDPKHIIMGASDEYGRYNLYKVNIYDGTSDIIADGNLATGRWLTDLQGVPRVRWDYDNTTEIVKIFLRRGDGNDWDLVTQYAEISGSTLKTGGPVIQLVGWTDDPKVAIVASRGTGDRYAIHEYDTISRTVGRQLLQHPRVDIGWPDGDAIHDIYSGKLLGFTFVDDVTLSHYFDPAWAKLQERFDGALPDASTVRPISWSRDLKKFVVVSRAANDPGTYYLFDTAKNTASIIARPYPNLPSKDLAETIIVKYAARDGTKIPGYLTLPPGKGDKNLPMVVMPHGGPEVRDWIVYDDWVQLIATRGYAVFQPNFRGSGGYGKAWAEAGHRNWGRLMQDDITDGVKALIKDGTADANRICIAGWSYGGYAALAGGAFTPDLYKCVISVAGISDINLLLSDMKNAAGSDSYSYARLIKWVGDPKTDQELIKATSPINFAKNFKAPVLLVHGSEDLTVRYHQSVMMDKALYAAGKKAKFVVIKDGWHSLDATWERYELYKETEQFLAEHLGK